MVCPRGFFKKMFRVVSGQQTLQVQRLVVGCRNLSPKGRNEDSTSAPQHLEKGTRTISQEREYRACSLKDSPEGGSESCSPQRGPLIEWNTRPNDTGAFRARQGI